MNQLLSRIVIESLLQTVMYIQMILVINLFLEIKKWTFIGWGIFIISLWSGLVGFILLGYDPITYAILASIVITFSIFKGKIAHKIFGITISITFNCITEIITAYIIGVRLEEMIVSVDEQRLFIQFVSAVVGLMGISILKSIGIISWQKDKNHFFSRKEALTLAIITVLSTGFMYMALRAFNGEVMVTGNLYVLGAVLISTLVLNLCIITLMNRNVHTNYYKFLSEMADRQLTEQIKYYEVLKKSHVEICSMRHDMKNHLLCIQILAREKDLEGIEYYIQKLACNVRNSTIQIYTGNLIVDALLNEKLSKAQDKGIKVETLLDKLSEINIDQMDLCIILSNALDNAIEAAEKVALTKDAVITIEIKVIKGYLVIYIKNSIQASVVIKKKYMIATTKEDKIHHGYGLKNIKEVVEKYEGVLKLTSDNGSFILEIMIKIGMYPI